MYNFSTNLESIDHDIQVFALKSHSMDFFIMQNVILFIYFYFESNGKWNYEQVFAWNFVLFYADFLLNVTLAHSCAYIFKNIFMGFQL